MLSLVLISCGEEDRSVKARRPTPASIEARMSYMIQESTYDMNNGTAFSKGVVAATASQIVGVDLYVTRSSDNSVKVDVDIVENLSTGCPTTRYTSGTISDSELKNGWVSVSGEEIKVACVNETCTYMGFIINRQTGGDPYDVHTRGTTVQAGALVLEVDPNGTSSNPVKYVPTESSDKSIYLNAYKADAGRILCVTHPAPTYDTQPAVDPYDYDDDGNNTDYIYFPYNNSFF